MANYDRKPNSPEIGHFSQRKILKAPKVQLKLNQKPALPNHLLITWSASGRYKRIQELKNDIAQNSPTPYTCTVQTEKNG
jgi:hypothetical protein